MTHPSVKYSEPILIKDPAWEIQGDQKVLLHWRLQYKLSVFEQSPHNLWVKDGHHRILSECGPCYTEYSLREHSSGCQ